jgi:phage-related protein
MGFDELNVIPKKSDASAGSGAAAGVGSGAYSNMGINPELPVIEVPDLSKFKEFMNKYGGLIQAFITGSMIAIGVSMAVLGFMSGNILMAVLGIGIAGLGIGIGSAGGENNLWARLGEEMSSALDAVVNAFKTAVSFIGGILSTAGAWIYDNVIAPIGNFFAGLWAGIVKIFTPALNWFGELFGSIAATIESIIVVIVGLFKGSWILIQHVWGIAATWFNDTIIQPIAGFFSGLWEGIKGAAAGAWEAIKSVFSPVASWFKNIFSKAWEGVKNVFSTGGKIFMGIVDGIANVFKTVVNAIITGINKVVAVPFNAINGILNFIRDIRIVGIKPFSGLWDKNPLAVPQIPKLAKGGIVDSATLAMIGERGKEAVVPLENNTEWMDKLAEKIGGNQPTKIVLMLDGNELGWANIRSINNITKQTGNLQLVMG